MVRIANLNIVANVILIFLVNHGLPLKISIEVLKEQRRILDLDNRQALAKWISEGVLLDYED
ncbi:hypothetical protein [Kriegella aquimaris]|uniref:N-acetylmuramoyl-L-alanine amidase n=1 Tax=Kriegella aquimaris TaxID=192904 RepID=A0A1G9MD12_9FLAO|nr:hypothetical protein [Kriegella aquimaris]SDL72089.1 N-acetylmuramoyl-L-alanine amidase [Kriegella aquimaris]